MSETAPDDSKQKPPAATVAAGSVSPDSALGDLLSLASQRPSVFATLIQHFPQTSQGEERIAVPLTSELVKQLVDADAETSKRRHSLRLQMLWGAVLVLFLILGFLAILVFLLRDHVEFTERVLACFGLLLTRGVATVGGYTAGKARSKRAAQRR